jgi:superfamily II DNA or RNA helicase
MNQGIYEELVTKLVTNKISELDKNIFQYKLAQIDKAEASLLLSNHIASVVSLTLKQITGENAVQNQIDVANKIILLLKAELNNEDFNDNLIESEGKILKAVFNKLDAHFSDLDVYLKIITPYTRLTQSELFTGGNSGLSLESELKKEILSSNRIDLLVSFIKWKGIIILKNELEEFTKRGGSLRVITTTYMGATDFKAIKILSELDNTEIKVSYNNGNERLHAKAYLFYRNSGFHTGYIGSSNFSRSALTDGLEWNLKITTKEVSHIIDKFQKTFESYWQNNEFETFDSNIHSSKLKDALNIGGNKYSNTFSANFFDIKPYAYQKEILEKLEVERSVHNRYKNLLVAATGTGKTVISAFDFKSYLDKNQNSRLLFIAHRKEILSQSLYTFRGVLKNNNFGQLWVDGLEPNNYEFVFASIQTINNRLENISLSPEYYDFIIIDEVHHSQALSYRSLLDYFKPKILLGLTATPERMDGKNILDDFSDRIAAEIRLPEALNKKLLCPFQYFGITDSVDLTNVRWEKGKYDAKELTNLYTSNDRRVNEIITHLEKYTRDIQDVRALGFCITIEHAKYMTEKFLLAGLKTAYLTSKNNKEREELKQKLISKEINYLFVVDIFNEGVDIPEIDTVLFLRPTESLTVFLQQLGRGLRLFDNKEVLTVLDFVANSRPEYDFEGKFRALIGKTNTSVKKEIEDNFPHLPLGCSIILEKKAKESILDNIRNATSLNKNQIIQKISSFEHHSNLPLTIRNFSQIYHIPLEILYKKDTWSRLKEKAGKIPNFEQLNEKEILSTIKNKWLSTNSYSYFNFILNLAKNNFEYPLNNNNEEEKLFALMLHYDVWQKQGGFKNLQISLKSIANNPTLVNEIIELLEYKLDSINFKELDIELPYKQPLKIHSRYTRDQILVAFGLSTFEKQSSNREGVAENKEIHTEILFIDLIKSDENFSPTTMYDDYAISDVLFHWQSQNQTRPDKGKGITYIEHEKLNKIILLFIREQAKDEYNNTMGYVFIGRAKYISHYGSKPMSITWGIEEPMPNYLWKDAAKLAIG